MMITRSWLRKLPRCPKFLIRLIIIMLAAPKYLLVLKYIEAKQRNGIINSVNTKYLITEQVWLI